MQPDYKYIKHKWIYVLIAFIICLSPVAYVWYNYNSCDNALRGVIYSMNYPGLKPNFIDKLKMRSAISEAKKACVSNPDILISLERDNLLVDAL